MATLISQNQDEPKPPWWRQTGGWLGHWAGQRHRRAVEKALGVLVVPPSARKAVWLDHLQQHILEVVTAERINQPKQHVGGPVVLSASAASVSVSVTGKSL